MRKHRRSLALVLLLGGMLMATACAPLTTASLPAQPNRFSPLSPAGSFRVGTASRMLVDTARPAETRYPQDDPERRPLMIQLWFPTDATDGFPLNPYLPDASMVDALQAQVPFDREALLAITGQALQGAPLSTQQATFPVLLFSHGFAGTRFQNTLHAEELAKRGFVVVAIDHTRGAALTAFPDGSRVGLDDRIDGARRADIWAADHRFVLDELTRLNQADPEGRLTNRLDLTKVGVFGHSAGGAAAAQACLQDPRFKAGVNMDGTPFGSVVASGLDQPFMVMTADPVAPDTPAFVDRLRGPSYLMTLRGAAHMSFTDLSVLPMPQPIEPSARLDARRALQITSSYLIAFFEKHLQGAARPLMDGSSIDYPEVELQARPARTN